LVSNDLSKISLKADVFYPLRKYFNLIYMGIVNNVSAFQVQELFKLERNEMESTFGFSQFDSMPSADH
jgi:hypothetical protein